MPRWLVRLPWLAAAASAAELTFPPELRADAGRHDLTIGHVTVPGLGISTRGYNNGLPGPTFRLKPGETLQIHLINDLVAANGKSCGVTGTEYCEVARTNLHMHGLHVSPKGTKDGLTEESDSIFVFIDPGESTDYSINTPANHMPGTHWYHPHHHHSTALQAGGGAAGVVVIEDPDGYLPPEYVNMEERVLFIYGHNLNTLQSMAIDSQSVLWSTAVQAAATAGLDTNLFFVNGQFGPSMTMESHSWYRFRMIFAAVEQGLSLAITGDGVCQLKLLAKDGVYLDTIPRDIPRIMLFSGARADVAVSCTCATYPCTAQLASSGARRLQGGNGNGNGGGGNGGGAGNGGGFTIAAATVMELVITQGPSTTVVDLPPTKVRRPCYLADLRSATVPAAQSGSLSFNTPTMAIQYNGQGEGMTYANVHAIGTMDDWPPLASFPVGSLIELNVNGVRAHAFHVHVAPFQITAMPDNSYDNGYFTIGDWHDTLLLRSLTGELTVRMPTDKFTGKMVVHCHLLSHEDSGMMSYMSITGAEGATYDQAPLLSPDCHADAFDASQATQTVTTATVTATVTGSTSTATTSTGTSSMVTSTTVTATATSTTTSSATTTTTLTSEAESANDMTTTTTQQNVASTAWGRDGGPGSANLFMFIGLAFSFLLV